MSLQCFFNIYFIPCLTSITITIQNYQWHPITITITKSGTSAWPPVPPLSSFSLSFFSIGTLQFRRQEDIDDIDHSDQSVDGDQVRKIISMIATNPRMQQMVRDDQWIHVCRSLISPFPIIDLPLYIVTVKGEHLFCRGIAAYIHLYCELHMMKKNLKIQT